MRPLLWKELRQGRPLLLFSAIAALALAGAGWVAARLKAGEGWMGNGPGTVLEVALAAVLTVLPLFLALLAGSGLFAAEADHGTIPVLFALPLSRRRIWAAKALCGLVLAATACALLLGLSRWLTAPVYDRLPLRPWPDLTFGVLTVFAIALFTTVLTPHVVGATIAAIPLVAGLAIGGRLLTQLVGPLLGYDTVVDVEFWAVLAAPALLYASVRAVRHGELLEWNRLALLHLPLVLVGMALMVLLAAGIGRATTGYSRQSVRQINADPAAASPSAAVVLSYSRPVAYQRGRTMVGSQAGDAPAWQTGTHLERRPLDWADPTAGSVNGGPLYRNTSAVVLDLKTGRELAVVREPLYTNGVSAAVSPDGSVAAIASARGGLTWGDIPWDRDARSLTIVDLRTGKRLYSDVPEVVRGQGDGRIRAMAWSPHGKHLAAELAGGTYLVPRNGKPLRAFPVRVDAGQAAWSQTEEALYAIAGGGLARIEAATGRVGTVWRPEASLGANSLALLTGGISPGDRWVAVMSSESATPQGEMPAATALLAVPTGKGEAQTIWRSPQPALLSGAWSRDGHMLYVLAQPQEERNSWKTPRPPTASVLRWHVGEPACTEVIASLPYPAATLTPLADGGVLVYPVRQFEEKQYTMRREPLPPTGGPFVVEASGSVRAFPSAASSLKFAADNDLVTVDTAGRVITVEGRPGSKTVRAWEDGKSVRLYP